VCAKKLHSRALDCSLESTRLFTEEHPIVVSSQSAHSVNCKAPQPSISLVVCRLVPYREDNTRRGKQSY
jgi:hypothetical protein